MPAIKNIVFDVGKVLFDYYPEKIVNAILPGNPLNPLYVDHLFLAQAWQDLDRGDISEDEAVEQLQDIFPKKDHVKGDLYRLIQEFALHLDPMDDSIALFNRSKIESYPTEYGVSEFKLSNRLKDLLTIVFLLY